MCRFNDGVACRQFRHVGAGHPGASGGEVDQSISTGVNLIVTASFQLTNLHSSQPRILPILD